MQSGVEQQNKELSLEKKPYPPWQLGQKLQFLKFEKIEQFLAYVLFFSYKNKDFI